MARNVFSPYDLGLDRGIELVKPNPMSEKDILDILALVQKEMLSPSALLSVIHDSVEIEVTVREPVTPDLTVTTLLKKPDLAWAVLEGLKKSKLLGPWREASLTLPSPGIQEAWERPYPTGGAVVVYRIESGWHVGWVMAPTGGADFERGRLHPSETSTGEVLLEVDEKLLEVGYILA